MALLEDIAAGKDAVVKACCASQDHNDIFNYQDILGKYDSLEQLTKAWLDDKLGTVKMLTGRRIEAEIKLCERQKADPEIQDDRPRWKYWDTKLKNLRLLKGLIEAWHGDMLGALHFTVSI
jgi:hypothetical protein